MDKLISELLSLPERARSQRRLRSQSLQRRKASRGKASQSPPWDRFLVFSVP